MSKDQDIAVVKAADRKLKPREEQWAIEYLQHFNAARAARAVGYSASSAKQRGYELKRDPAVAAYLERRLAEIRRNCGVNADAVYMQLVRAATADMTEFAKWDSKEVTFKPSDELPPGSGMLIKEISQGKDGIKLKLEDRMPALTRLGQENGMFVKRVDARLGRLPETEVSEEELIRIANGEEG